MPSISLHTLGRLTAPIASTPVTLNATPFPTLPIFPAASIAVGLIPTPKLKVEVPTALAATTPVTVTVLTIRTVSEPRTPAASTPVTVTVFGIEATAVPMAAAATTPVTSTGAGSPQEPLPQVPRPHPATYAITLS